MNFKKIKILSVLLTFMLVSCNNDVEDDSGIRLNYIEGIKKLDNFSLKLPELQEGVKTYSLKHKNVYAPYEYKTEEGYKLISDIINISEFYDEKPDGWPMPSILYYFSDNTYLEVAVDFRKMESPYFKDKYLLHITGTNYKHDEKIYCCVYDDAFLFDKIKIHVNDSSLFEESRTCEFIEGEGCI